MRVEAEFISVRTVVRATWSALLLTGMLQAGASAQDAAIPDSVATDVEGSSPEATGEARFSEAPGERATSDEEDEKKGAQIDWSLNAGGSVNTGNTQSWNISSGTDFKLTKKVHTLTIGALFNFGRANADPADPESSYETVARQFFARARYDYFFTDKDAVWSSITERWDPFAGFDTQLLVEAGYLHAFLNQEKHYLALRIGYSYTYENYRQVTDESPTGTANVQGLLAALDYRNQLNEHVQFLSSITTIVNVNEIDATGAEPFEDVRIYLTAALLASVTDRLAFEARFLLLYDRIPPAPQKTDTTTIFSLVYTIF